MVPVIADSNWLLSTLVQSSAALVAIVGGLLVSRLVTLATERNGVERRIGQLERVASTRREQAELAAKAWLDRDAEAFLDDCEDEVISRYGDGDFDALYDTEDNAGRSKDELRPYFEQLCQRVKEMNRSLILEHGRARPDEWSDKRKGVEQAAVHSDRYLFSRVIDNLEETHWQAPPSRYVLAAPYISPAVYGATSRATADRRYDETVREAETARAAQALAKVELDQARAELAALGRPAGFEGALWVLVGIACTGIVLPLAVMSNGAYEVPATARVLLVLLFVTALVAFMLFLRTEIKRATSVSSQWPDSR